MKSLLDLLPHATWDSQNTTHSFMSGFTQILPPGKLFIPAVVGVKMNPKESRELLPVYTVVIASVCSSVHDIVGETTCLWLFWYTKRELLATVSNLAIGPTAFKNRTREKHKDGTFVTLSKRSL